jgi:LAO/AO transport system kinase
LLCESAGYDVIFIETVGVGQSEVMVKEMVDFFLLLMLAGAGDELQGIKKGIMEMADAVLITKADGDNIKRAQQAQSQFQSALHLFAPNTSGWVPKVLTCSSLNDEGLTEIWKLVGEYQQTMKKTSYFEENRKLQKVNWMHQEIKSRLESDFYDHPLTTKNLALIEKKVISGEISAGQAAQKLLSAFNNEK